MRSNSLSQLIAAVATCATLSAFAGAQRYDGQAADGDYVIEAPEQLHIW